jgi:hypothetical protein
MRRRAMDNPAPCVNRRALCLIIPDFRFGASDRLDDAAELNRPDRCAREQRREKKMIARADNRNVVRLHMDTFDEAKPRKPGAEDDEFLPGEVQDWGLGIHDSRFTIQDSSNE